MNIYDKKIVKCSLCGKCIGEIDYDSRVILPKCGNCAEPLPHISDKMYSIISKIQQKKI